MSNNFNCLLFWRKVKGLVCIFRFFVFFFCATCNFYFFEKSQFKKKNWKTKKKNNAKTLTNTKNAHIHTHTHTHTKGGVNNHLHSLSEDNLKNGWLRLEPKGTIPAPRKAAGMVCIDKQLFLFGGNQLQGKDDNLFNDMFIYRVGLCFNS